METFDWLATDSAPENHPMQIVRGDFVLSNGGSLYIPDTRTLYKGWGAMESLHIVGPDLKPLPTGIEITFFSYLEDVFYRGSFDLPHDKIIELFKNGYYSPKRRADTTYEYIMTGIAPGGAVAVWLAGTDRVTEVFYDRAEKVDLPWSEISENPGISREEFVRLTIEESVGAGSLPKLDSENEVIDRWDKYRTTYRWQPLVDAVPSPALINAIDYFNGELDYLRYPLDEAIAAVSRPVPKRLTYIWRNSKNNSYWVKYYFDETEIFAAFDELAPDGQTALQLELKVEELTGGGRTISSLLRNQERVIHLEQTRLESPPTGLSDEEIDSM